MNLVAAIRAAVIWFGLLVILAWILEAAAGSGAWGLVAIVAAIGLALYWSAARARRIFGRIQRHLAAGEPEPLLRLVDKLLRRRRNSASRGPLLIFRAAGLSMQGRWDEAMAVLGEIDVDGFPEPGRSVWLFGYHGARFGCLIFTEHIDEARSVLERDIEPLAETPGLRHAGQAVLAARAELAFCEGEHDEAQSVFDALVADGRVPPASRAVFHYFLGRIASDAEDESAAARHFAQAADLGKHTWIPEGIRALGRAQVVEGTAPEPG